MRAHDFAKTFCKQLEMACFASEIDISGLKIAEIYCQTLNKTILTFVYFGEKTT